MVGGMGVSALGDRDIAHCLWESLTLNTETWQQTTAFCFVHEAREQGLGNAMGSFVNFCVCFRISLFLLASVRLRSRVVHNESDSRRNYNDERPTSTSS